MRIFAGEWVKNILTRLGMQEGEAIESRMVSRRIEGAQKKVEERNFEIRKNLLEYDEVMDEQRKRVYGYRQRILDGGNCKELDPRDDRQPDRASSGHFPRPAIWRRDVRQMGGRSARLRTRLQAVRRHRFRSRRPQAKSDAEHAAESQIFDAIEENLPEGEEDDELNWEAVAKFSNTRWKTNYRDKDIRKIGRNELAEVLIEKSKEAIDKVDLSEGAKFLTEDFGIRTACGWVQHKFGMALDPQEVRKLEPEAFKNLVAKKAAAAYDEKEVEYPVMAGLYHFSVRDASGQKRFDREKLVAWAKERFHVDLDLDDLKSKQREEIRALLIEQSRTNHKRADEVLADLRRRINDLPDEALVDKHLANGADPLAPLTAWLRETIGYEAQPGEFAGFDREKLKNRLSMIVEDHFRPEMRRMERAGARNPRHGLERSSAGDGPFAFIRRPARLCASRSQGGIQAGRDANLRDDVDEHRRTRHRFDLPHGAARREFRRLDLEASHGDPRRSPLDDRHRPPAATGDRLVGRGDTKIEPIRNRTPKVGRNDPCPCGSGKKYKNCHMKKGGVAGGVDAA